MKKENLLETETIKRYKDTALRMLKLSFPSLSHYEIERALDHSIRRRFKNTNAKIDNNYKKKVLETTLLDISEYLMNRKPIITPYGVLFKRHGEVPNPIAKLLEGFMEGRNIYKKEMFKYPKGSEEYERYNLLQLLAKIDA